MGGCGQQGLGGEGYKGAAIGLHALVPRLGQPNQDCSVDTPPQAVENSPVSLVVHVTTHPTPTVPGRGTIASGCILQCEEELRNEVLHKVDVEAVQPHIPWHRGVGEANHNAARAAARASTEQHGAEEEVAPHPESQKMSSPHRNGA